MFRECEIQYYSSYDAVGGLLRNHRPLSDSTESRACDRINLGIVMHSSVVDNEVVPKNWTGM